VHVHKLKLTLATDSTGNVMALYVQYAAPVIGRSEACLLLSVTKAGLATGLRPGRHLWCIDIKQLLSLISHRIISSCHTSVIISQAPNAWP